MEFGSSFVYVYDEPEFEVISDDELDEGMQLSASESDSDDESVVDRKRRKHNWRNVRSEDMYETPSASVSGRRERRADTNVVSIDFSKLIAPSHMFTGDPVYCQQCKAILSHISKITKTDQQQVWTCEFCEARNEINVENEEIPKDVDVTFMLEPAPSTSVCKHEGTDDSLVIFCIDVSTSMRDETKVQDRMNLDERETYSSGRRLRRCHRGGVTYISRIQAVQNAVHEQLNDMYRTHPNRRVGLVLFNDEIEVICDGSGSHLRVAGKTLNSRSKLVQIAEDLKLPFSAIKDRKQELTDEVSRLRAHGSTALGPALLISTVMAAHHPGSKVIICTDGEANTGIGSFDDGDVFREGQFYEEVGMEASSKGVTISVISFTGTDCKLAHLGKLADTTGGQVNIVDSDKLTEEFSTILARNIIATKVVATFNLHKQLFIQSDDKTDSYAVRQIGNVTDDTEITFEYGIRTNANQSTPDLPPTKTEEKQELKGNSAISAEDVNAVTKDNASKIKVEIPNELPFQIQIKYKDTEGATAMRVVTQTQPVTRDRRQAEQNANVQVLGSNVQKQTAALALEGCYSDSRVKAMMNQRLVWRHKKIAPQKFDRKASRKMYGNIFSNVSKLENKILSAQKSERARRRGRSYSRSCSDDEDYSYRSRCRSRSRSRSRSGSRSRLRRQTTKTVVSKEMRKKAMRAKEMSDAFSVSMFQSKIYKPADVQCEKTKSVATSSSDKNVGPARLRSRSPSSSDSDYSMSTDSESSSCDEYDRRVRRRRRRQMLSNSPPFYRGRRSVRSSNSGSFDNSPVNRGRKTRRSPEYDSSPVGRCGRRTRSQNRYNYVSPVRRHSYSPYRRRRRSFSPNSPVYDSPTSPVYYSPTSPDYDSPLSPDYASPVYGLPISPVYDSPTSPVSGSPTSPVYES